jgi:hypothetical protein
MDNCYENNVAGNLAEPRDVWLTPNFSDTVVMERIETVVLDEGSANSVSTISDDSANYCEG